MRVDAFDKARLLLEEFKENRYLHGMGVLPRVGQVTAPLGRRTILVRDQFPGSGALVETIKKSLVS